MKIWDDYRRVLDVIDSCQNTEQLKTALKMLGFWYDKYLDYQVYQHTCRTHVKLKYSNLGGVNINEMPFKNIVL